MKIIAGVLSILLSVAYCALMPAHSQQYEAAETASLLKGLPSDAASFLERADGCLHWGGEEAFDKKRANEIKKAVKELRCSDLNGDHAALQIKYRGRADITKTLDYVRKYYLR